MLPVTNGAATRGTRGRVGSNTNLRRMASQAGRPAAIALACLLLIGGTSLLLHSRISDEQAPGLHVVSGGGAAADRVQLLAEGATLEQGSQGVRQQQQQDLGAVVSTGGPLFGSNVKLAADQATASDAAGKQAGQSGRDVVAHISKLAELGRGAKLDAARGKSHQLYGTLASSFPQRPDPPIVELSEDELASRREAVRAAMLHSWRGYEKYAWGNDELCPVTLKGKNGFGGLGATMIDALDTLHMMGFMDEYTKAAAWVRAEMPLDTSFDASVFETIIRVVGGMLAAHDMTGDQWMVDRAQQVADRILPAYNTPTGIPLNIINLATQVAKNPTWNQRASTLSEFGTHQLEFWRLSESTGNRTYADLAEGTIRHLHKLMPDQGLMPLFISPTTGNFTVRRISFGALGDSYYEYLLKMWLLQGKQDDMYRSMWETAMDEMIEKLVFTSKEGLVYVAEFDRNLVKHKFDHLVCFVPGMLALGAHSGAVTGAKAEAYMRLAGDLTHTCWQMYHRMPSGLSPEYVTFTPQGMKVGAAYNMLRPEALEAMWYMWRLTHDWKYRVWAWEIFQAFETHSKAEAGYSGVKDVRAAEPVHDDTQQSFFLAETLKYLFLLFSDDSSFNMDEWVLNTEAHPLKVSRPIQQQQQQQQQHQQKQPGRSRDVGGMTASGNEGRSIARR
ncbi:hypothetical protein D9Q98_010078 [Chlorella vulgaris]|uniref:alpha-1,2-Mannosidase n=1 Tax=Chlorella vulgaris TaxID=3077 RepID=A0A9D4TNH6_CHLVU|nr:hypothetical protein D9Q98_010078 [Chlorella vulgaris]